MKLFKLDSGEAKVRLCVRCGSVCRVEAEREQGPAAVLMNHRRIA